MYFTFINSPFLSLVTPVMMHVVNWNNKMNCLICILPIFYPQIHSKKL